MQHYLMRLTAVATLLAGAAACNPAAVDPDATFTIQGRLADLNGDPAADVTVQVVKVDDWLEMAWVGDSLLHYVSLGDLVSRSRIYSTTSDSGGNFTFSLKGYEVNTDSGTGAAFLATVYVDPNDPYLATATDWHFFRNDNPVWSTGTLRLWNAAGASADQEGNEIRFNWGQNPAPAGFDNDPARPYFLFAYEYGAPSLQWGEHTFGTSVTIPRGAFDGGTTRPEYFLVGYSQESGGSRAYTHRTSLHDVGVYFSDSAARGLPATMWDGMDQTIETDGYIDPTRPTYLVGRPTTLYADLGAPMNVRDVLVYSLGVMHLDNAVITMDISDDLSSWLPLASYTGDRDFENWLYIGYTGDGSDYGQYIRIEVSNRGGPEPYLEFIDELMVVVNN